ncbi:AMIN domain-containing protein [Sinorhizobium meliloti]|uniref:N-acetylmuramoyl-L-alanine amidase n=5 Tax=Sinorhizobium TaxID=28105 RepID=A0A222J704_RHIML|nr:N-acetylmuramoyl-L-alanine amidase [Sinorhizobium meliloti RU11/001]ASP64101.1 N-acetylmuramoyl-L-alanine amidase [Sinorhizobium meliloti]PST27989.1 N-acetylmuramoyl-L-alanine amidase [Mesorhizobium loti]ASP84683.1 N-acetylmuramoyl-L-alanine amidase [Sinorhizobium meliloti]ASP91073.1 N-acetylmuramoyl-L-alanine amidase [Sinorhizobium meliloti]
MDAGFQVKRSATRLCSMEAIGRHRGMRMFVAAFGAVLLLLSPVAVVRAGEPVPLLAYAARIAGDDARTRLVIEFDREPAFSIHYVANPVRVIVDLPETSFGLKPESLQPRGLFDAIRYGGMGAGASRLVLSANGPTEVTHAEVKPVEDGKGFRLVLDAERIGQDRFDKLLAEQQWTGTVPSAKTDRPAAAPPPKAGVFVVAIDAGHGGIDTGAIGGVTKTEEKHVTLAFAKELVERLNHEPGIEAFLTRERDEFLSLPQRVQIARQRGSNLFISVHADTLRQKEIRGATVYTISDKASDHLAADLAARENLSDEIAGIPLESEPAEVADILIDLTRRETQAFSVNLARSVISSFEGQIKLINNPHRHAGFRVLQAPDVPSVLLELGFLSNKEDEKQLLDAEWRKKVSTLLADAVQRYRNSAVANGG